MTQDGAVIANLQSALGCVGKCDCCDGLQSQINDLRGQISTKIGQEEKPAIIQQSVASVEQLLVPGILFFVGNAVNGLRPEIAAVATAASQAAAAASQAAATATNAVTAVAGGIAQLAGMATQIVAILASIATLGVLGARIDTVESLALSIGNDLSEALSLIGIVKSLAAEAKGLASQALAEVGYLAQYVGGLPSTILSQVNALRMELEGIIDARLSELNNLIKGIVATLPGIIALVGNIETQLQSFKESIAVLQSQSNSIFGKVGVLEGKTGIIEQKVGVLEGAIGKTWSDIAGLWTSVFALPTTISTLVQEGIQTFVPPVIQTLVPPAIQTLLPPAIQTAVPPVIQTLVPPVIQTLVPPAIQTLVPPMIAASVPGIIGDVSLVVNNWISVNVPPFVTNLVNNMPAVDLSPVLQAIATVDAKVDDTFELVGTVDGTTKDTNVVAKIVDNKLGKQIRGGLGGWMLRFTTWSVLDRLTNLLTLATTIHNAQQLSSNIFVTLITAMQNILDFLGIEDSEGKMYNITELVGQTVTSLTTLLIGQDNYDNFVKEWAKYNRTYQAAGNLFSSLMNMGDTVTQALQVVSSQTGKIGNALRAWGVVSDKAYSWMNPNPNFSNPLLTKLTSLQETASMVESVSQQPLNIKSAKEEIDNASKELRESLEQKDGSKQGSAIPEAKKVKAEQEEIVAASKGKDLSESDLTSDEDDI